LFSYYQFHEAYTQTKAEAEQLVMKANDINELRTCCIRPGSICGSGDGIIPTLVSYGGMRVSTYIVCIIIPLEHNSSKTIFCSS
jgi:nucleoside-diphosphate-sugar epimerase